MRQFLDLLAASVIVQGLLALMSMAGVIWLAVLGRVDAGVVVGVLFVVVGFYFGQKTARPHA